MHDSSGLGAVVLMDVYGSDVAAGQVLGGKSYSVIDLPGKEDELSSGQVQLVSNAGGGLDGGAVATLHLHQSPLAALELGVLGG